MDKLLSLPKIVKIKLGTIEKTILETFSMINGFNRINCGV